MWPGEGGSVISKACSGLGTRFRSRLSRRKQSPRMAGSMGVNSLTHTPVQGTIARPSNETTGNTSDDQIPFGESIPVFPAPLLRQPTAIKGVPIRCSTVQIERGFEPSNASDRDILQ